MKPELWQQLDELFQAAMDREPGERAAFLDEACAGDESLRKQVEALLFAHQEAESFIEIPAMDLLATALDWSASVLACLCQDAATETVALQSMPNLELGSLRPGIVKFHRWRRQAGTLHLVAPHLKNNLFLW